MKKLLRWDLAVLLFLIAYALIPGLNDKVETKIGIIVGKQLTDIFVFALLALALNVVVGYSGLLQLGIAAFFGIGAYTAGIFTVEKYPFQIGFWWAVPLGITVAALAGVLLAAPTLRLRGDYLAIVTLGFGEIVRVALLNFFEITDGPQGLNPLPTPTASPLWPTDFRLYYFLCLGFIVLVVVLLRNLENSRLGRAWMAIREDELAATCMGVNPVRAKLSAFAIGAAIAGLAGVLYATKLTTTADPSNYGFNISIIVLCYIIIGGLGSINGALLGAFLIEGYDKILTPIITKQLKRLSSESSDNFMLDAGNWRWLIFGLALILMMRFRPEGLLPSKRVKEELHHEPPT